MSGPQAHARDWAEKHVDTVVRFGEEPWRIAAVGRAHSVVLLRSTGDDLVPRVASAEAVRRAYMADNS